MKTDYAMDEMQKSKSFIFVYLYYSAVNTNMYKFYWQNVRLYASSIMRTRICVVRIITVEITNQLIYLYFIFLQLNKNK